MIHLREEDLEVLSHCLIIGQNSITVSSCCGLPSYFSFVMHSLFWGLANSCERMNYEKEMINFIYCNSLGYIQRFSGKSNRKMIQLQPM